MSHNSGGNAFEVHVMKAGLFLIVTYSQKAPLYTFVLVSCFKPLQNRKLVTGIMPSKKSSIACIGR